MWPRGTLDATGGTQIESSREPGHTSQLRRDTLQAQGHDHAASPCSRLPRRARSQPSGCGCARHHAKALGMSVSEGRPGAGRAVASGVMAEAGAMVPTSDSDLTGLSKVSVLQLLRMSLHERLCTATLLQHSQARARDACLKRSIVAPYGVAWVQESPCGTSAVF